MKQRNLVILRFALEKHQALGTMHVVDECGNAVFNCKSMELDWENNVRKGSCIPPGTYKVEKRTSEKYGHHFHVLNVPNRDMILIHAANFHRELLGCIAPGAAHLDIDKDGCRDVTSSKQTLAKLLELLPDSFTLEIQQPHV